MRKRIWHLLSNPWNSAITEYALSSVLSLKLSSYQNFLTPLSGSPAEKRAKDLKIPSLPIKSFSALSFPKLLAYYKKIKPDYIFVYGGKETFFAKLLKHDKIIRFRGDDRDSSVDENAFYYKFTQNHIAGLITPCDFIGKSFSKTKIPNKTILLGLNPGKFKPMQDKKEERRINIHIIGRFDPIKGHKSFFKLYALALKKRPFSKPPFLNILGQEEGVSAKELRAYAEECGLILSVDFQITPYRIDNIQNVMAQSDLVVIPSEGSEVICRVAEESLMCGSKVFVSGVGALEEVLKDKSFGVSYKGLSIENAADLFVKTLEEVSKENLEEREKRAHLASSLFSLNKMGQDLYSFIEALP